MDTETYCFVIQISTATLPVRNFIYKAVDISLCNHFKSRTHKFHTNYNKEACLEKDAKHFVVKPNTIARAQTHRNTQKCTHTHTRTRTHAHIRTHPRARATGADNNLATFFLRLVVCKRGCSRKRPNARQAWVLLRTPAHLNSRLLLRTPARLNARQAWVLLRTPARLNSRLYTALNAQTTANKNC